MRRQAFALFPLERFGATLVQAHQAVGTLGEAAGNQLVGTEGTVGKQQVARAEVAGETGGGLAVVLGVRAGFDVLPAAVAEVEQTDDAHRGKAAAFLLDRRLRVKELVFLGIHEMNRTPVHGHECEALPLVLPGDTAAELLADALMDCLEEGEAQAAAGLAVTGSVRGGNRQLAGVAPALNESDSLLAGGVGLKDLGQPGPEHRQMTKAALPFGGVDGGQEVARKDVIEEYRIPAQGAPADDGGGLADRGLQAALGSGENG